VNTHVIGAVAHDPEGVKVFARSAIGLRRTQTVPTIGCSTHRRDQHPQVYANSVENEILE